MIDGSGLKAGDKVSFQRDSGTHRRGEVGIVTESYVRIDWTAGHYDVLSKQSPVWCWIDKR